MTYDFSAKASCDHRIYREFHRFEEDLFTIKPAHIFANDRITVFLNNYETSQYDVKNGWELVLDETSVSPNKKNIVFKYPRKTANDWVEINYSVPQEECIKCHGLGNYYDLIISPTGKLVLANRENKLSQDAEKIIFTVLGTNMNHNWYGSGLSELIAQKQTVDMDMQISSAIMDALDNLKDLQQQQETYQLMDDPEVLEEVLNIEVTPDTQDPFLYYIEVTLLTRAATLVTIQRMIQAGVPLFDNIISGVIE